MFVLDSAGLRDKDNCLPGQPQSLWNFSAFKQWSDSLLAGYNNLWGQMFGSEDPASCGPGKQSLQWLWLCLGPSAGTGLWVLAHVDLPFFRRLKALLISPCYCMQRFKTQRNRLQAPLALVELQPSPFGSQRLIKACGGWSLNLLPTQT